MNTLKQLSSLCLLALVLPLGAAHAADDDDPPRIAPPTIRPMPGPGLRGLDGPIRPPGLEELDEDEELEPLEPIDDAVVEEEEEDTAYSPAFSGADRNKPPCANEDPTARFKIDFVEQDINDVVKYFAEISCRNFILGDELSGKVTIISHKEVPFWSAYAAFESALEVSGYTTVQVGDSYKIVATSKASQHPLKVYEGDSIPYSDTFVTQIFQLDNVSVGDISTVAKDLGGGQAKILAYAPTNTLIVTDSAVNIRRMWKVVSQLDVAAPRAELEIVQIEHAEATEIKTLIEQIYGSEESTTSTTTSSSSSESSSSRRRRHRSKDKSADTASSASSSTVGKEGKYIEKIVADERSNKLIIMANSEAMEAVLGLIDELDKDVDPRSRAQIHVKYLEHANAEDIAQVLSNLSQDTSSTSSRNSRSTRTSSSSSRRSLPGRDSREPETSSESSGSATALLDDGVRVTADESTNSLVIVASPEAFEIIEDVIAQLDIRRKQVFVEVVIMELASEDTLDVGVGLHSGKPGDSAFGFGSLQLGTSSLGLSSDVLTGLAMGVFGDSINVSVDGQEVPVPAFGIVLSAMQANSSVNILSTPNVLTLDNEEAKIVVGRNIPFPTSQGRDSNNNPIVSYSREDVAITLKVTPQINESDYVTLELFQEVTEIEEDSQGLDVTSAGFITSKRSAETTVLVKDNQTIVIGGLMGATDTEVESKVPVLGDLPLVGVIFRGKRKVSRKTNLLIFLTPHVISTPADLEEVYRVKVAQREEFLRRFYGKTEVEQLQELNDLLAGSMNVIDEPSMYRTKISDGSGGTTTIGEVPEEEDEADLRDEAAETEGGLYEDLDREELPEDDLDDLPEDDLDDDEEGL